MEAQMQTYDFKSDECAWIFADSELVIPTDESKIKKSSKQDKFFACITEDPSTPKVGVCYNEFTKELISELFDREGGQIGIKINSGKAFIGSCDKKYGSEIPLENGIYSLEYYEQTFNSDYLHKREKELMGEKDYTFFNRVNIWSLLPYFNFVVMILLLLIPFTRLFWIFAVGQFLIPMFTILIIRNTKRHKKLEGIMQDLAKEMSSPVPQILLLKQIGTEELDGGYLYQR